ncbi:MAG TPA: Hsp70 family protein [Thermoanaerobaculia bacterium]|nr:Hsp70 family protein [Thermoanaerobaculia bacterium]
MSARRVYGIDLGTTYSCIAHVDEHGKPVVLANAEGEATTPSVVYFESADNVVVGEGAKGVVAIHPDLCVSTVKRSMGDPHWERSFHGKSYKPQAVSALILRKVVGDAEKLLNEKVEDVVITCPAYFGINEKEATKQAGEIAGLNVLYVIPEPTAAALAYGIDQKDDQVILVYDLGGGTFDVTLIEIKGGDITVICTGGDHQLGGKDWDDALVTYLAQRFEEQTGTSADSLLEDLETYQELLTDAEKCKKLLSSRESVSQSVSFGGEKVKVEISRATFNELTAHLLERTLTLTQEELDKAQAKGYARIDKLLLVGGSTYMPQVIEAVKSRFPFEVRQFDPNQAVAKGAALFGYKCYLGEQIRLRVAELTGQQSEKVDLSVADQKVIERAQEDVARNHGLSLVAVRTLHETRVTNVSSKSFGMVALNESHRDVVFNLILVNQQVPKTISQEFFTVAEGQTRVDMRCMENRLTSEQVEISDSALIGETVLTFSRPVPQGSPIEVTFDLGPDGLLKVHGRDLTTGGEIRTEIETKSILSREEVIEARDQNRALDVA